MAEDGTSSLDASQLDPGLRRGGGVPALDPWLLSKLACPLTRQSLRYDAAGGELISHAAGLAYPIRDDVPIMLVEEARQLP